MMSTSLPLIASVETLVKESSRLNGTGMLLVLWWNTNVGRI